MSLNRFDSASASSVRTCSLIAAVTFLVVAAVAFCGCSDQRSEGDSVGADIDPGHRIVRIGTMPTEDMLPAWVAQEEGFFDDEGISVNIIPFDSAPALSAAMTAGEVDMMMTDAMRAVKLSESGCPLVIEWITLGSDSSQGRFGVLAPSDAPYATLEELAAYAQSAEAPEGFGVAVAANTVPEYVLDKLCEEAGISADALSSIEIASLPERYSLVASGNVGAAALPGSLLALGEANGLKLLANDADGTNISQSVMVARERFAQEHPDEVLAVASAWDRAVDLIAGDPQAYLPTLIAHANINESIAENYPISSYPYALNGNTLAHPEAALIDPQIEWMVAKGYGGEDAFYDENTGTIALADAN